MTALKKFSRLECPGIWRPSPDAQRQDVIVSFGEASLVISDRNERALSHWSLAAVVRINRGESPALYTPSAEATETLEIDDETMIEAIETVRGAILKARPHRGRLRLVLFGSITAVVLGFAALWLPGVVMRHTLSVVPDPTRAEIGTKLFQAIGRLTGSPCRSERGDQALARLQARLFTPGKGALLVMPEGLTSTISLPGGVMLLSRKLVESPETPEVTAGYILAEAERQSQADPLEAVLQTAGPLATLRLLTTGHLGDDALQSYAEALTSLDPPRVPDEPLLGRFAAAGVSSTPYAYALDITGESTLKLIEGDPMRSEGARKPVLDDGDWVALQGICGN